MHLISTGKTTVLSDFVDLETKSTYNHDNGESTDFQFTAKRRTFLEVNRKSGLELMRIKDRSERTFELQRVRKLTIDNVYCVGCAKQAVEDIAVGLSSGHVKLYNYKSAQLLHRFQAENIRNTVLFLDYNCTDEYISSVLESGDINIYGIKTKTKIDSINIDGNSTLSRFHPNKRFQLSIASYKGAVTVYDVQSKRKLFHSTNAHEAPCRDICMCSTNPSTLLSVGYDCKINIFDIRRKAQMPNVQLAYTHPLSTVALSDCGVFFCVGNLKGELISYDMRNTKTHLAARKVHDCAVTRLGFVPIPEDSAINSFTSTCNTTVGPTTNVIATAPPPQTAAERAVPSGGDLRKSIVPNIRTELATPAAARGYRDSFCDFLDTQSNKVLDRMSSRLTLRRDSFDWEALARKPSNEDTRNSLTQINSGLSSIGSVNTSAANSLEIKSNADDKSAQLQQTLSGPLRDRSNSSNKLVQIDEEQPSTRQDQEPYSVDNSTSSDKENPTVELELHKRLRILPASRNSTPNQHSAYSNTQMDAYLSTQAKSVPNLVKSVSSTLSSIEGNDIRKEINDLRGFIDERFKQMECEFRFVTEANKWQMYTQSTNLWNTQMETTKDIRDGVAALLQQDVFVNEFVRLQNENRILKQQLVQLQQEQVGQKEQQDVTNENIT